MIPTRVRCLCGWDAGGDLRLTTDDFFGRPMVTEDAGPDDHHWCPECDREIRPDTVVPVGSSTARVMWFSPSATIEGDAGLVLEIDNAFYEAVGEPLFERFFPTVG